MTNVLAPFGLRYVGRNDGAEPNYAISYQPIYYTDSNKVAYGDAVKTVTSGINQGYASLSGTNTQISGVFLGCFYTDSVLGLVERPAWTAPSTAIQGSVQAKIIPDANAVFEIQVGNLTTAISQTSIGLNAAMGSLGNPSTTAGISNAYLDGSTIATTNTLPLRIVGFSQGFFNGAQNDPTSANPVVLVRFNVADSNTTTGV